ncbi:hypothetical protein Glove_606g161 [Diversispora epigaea]|uniref:Uncharacterized protein n=1 Tax=Diversispora epigaea TaxID=1348612 RepID=A0A397G8G3_9GLOM|nr:hypothetical protein Glove_606g161 [Diversispora epigaea]
MWGVEKFLVILGKINKAFVNGEFEIARQEYTKGIEVSPEDPRLWSNRAQTFIKLLYPELAIVDATNALSLIEPKIISGIYDNADLVLFCKSGWRKAEALAKSDEHGSAAKNWRDYLKLLIGEQWQVLIGMLGNVNRIATLKNIAILCF